MPFRVPSLSITTLTLTMLLFASTARAQHRHEHDEPRAAASGQQHEHAQPEASLCDCPIGRESSGTSWQPDATTVHPRTFAFGDWQLAAHAQVSAVYADEDGPRGDDKFFSTNHVMITGRRQAGAGVFWRADDVVARTGDGEARLSAAPADRRDRGWRDAAGRSPGSIRFRSGCR